MGWSIVLELDGKQPQLIGDYRREQDAAEAAVKLMYENAQTGGKVSVVRKHESTDQLQRYGQGSYVREQPELPAVGEDVTVYAGKIHLPRGAVHDVERR